MRKEFSLIGLGIASWLGIISIAYTIRLILIDFLIIANIKFPYIHLSYELFYTSLFIGIFYFFLNYLKTKNDLNYSKLAQKWVIFFILVQMIQFYWTLEIGDYILENYHDNWSSFNNYNKKTILNLHAYSIGEVLRYLGLALLIYKFMKD
ncbi:hypothetical protein [Flavobacterium sp. J27]|uniref:hypothetical protein n=1 Tax=Flavobacterium sp. J27 TaxID=2060419 RepID=UPI0010312B0E|nr:hypothetical protein [Flavobacterium sp. J27]